MLNSTYAGKKHHFHQPSCKYSYLNFPISPGIALTQVSKQKDTHLGAVLCAGAAVRRRVLDRAISDAGTEPTLLISLLSMRGNDTTPPVFLPPTHAVNLSTAGQTSPAYATSIAWRSPAAPIGRAATGATRLATYIKRHGKILLTSSNWPLDRKQNTNSNTEQGDVLQPQHSAGRLSTFSDIDILIDI
ncbi:unnamed protein product [Colias eurytheme]|nr:unnamed protein product [Colias eurytheme]